MCVGEENPPKMAKFLQRAGPQGGLFALSQHFPWDPSRSALEKQAGEGGSQEKVGWAAGRGARS